MTDPLRETAVKGKLTTVRKRKSHKTGIPKRELAKRAQAMRAAGKRPVDIAAILGLNRKYIYELFNYRVDGDKGSIVFVPEPKAREEITDPLILECLVDTPEGFRAFFNRYSGFQMADHNFATFQAAFCYPEECEHEGGKHGSSKEVGSEGSTSVEASGSEGTSGTDSEAFHLRSAVQGGDSHREEREAGSPSGPELPGGPTGASPGPEPDRHGDLGSVDPEPDRHGNDQLGVIGGLAESANNPINELGTGEDALPPPSDAGGQSGPEAFLGHWKDQVCENIAPRHAKSETWAVWFVIWRFVLDRSVRVILLSKAHMLAGQFTDYIARKLEHDPALVRDFGRFQSAEGEGVWKPASGELDIAGKSQDLKERSLRARGSGEQIFGLGCDWLIADDVVTTANSTTTEQRDKLDTWFHQEALSRLEPGGHVVVIGARLHRDDLYGRLVNKTVVDDEDPEDREDQLWEHIVFPCLRDPVTGGASVDLDALPLWPDRWPRRKLMRIKANFGQSVFSATYQQDPISPEERLIKPEWIYGDATHIGCLDPEREVLEPRWPRQEVVRVVSIDPSPTKYAAMILADVRSREGMEIGILDVERKRMGEPEMLKVMDRWVEVGPIDFVIFEDNQFARWFLQSKELQDWCRLYRVRAVKHSTTPHNKPDPLMGFSTIAPEFEFGHIHFPYLGVQGRMLTKEFADEACNYVDKNDTNDRLMALWFIKNKFFQLYKPGVEGSGMRGHFAMQPRFKEARWTKVKKK